MTRWGKPQLIWYTYSSEFHTPVKTQEFRTVRFDLYLYSQQGGIQLDDDDQTSTYSFKFKLFRSGYTRPSICWYLAKHEKENLITKFFQFQLKNARAFNISLTCTSEILLGEYIWTSKKFHLKATKSSFFSCLSTKNLFTTCHSHQC